MLLEKALEALEILAFIELTWFFDLERVTQYSYQTSS